MGDTVTARTDNWGRWGEGDERGALNLLTPDVVLAATRVCTTGRVYSLSLPIQQEGVPIVAYRNPPMRLTLTNDSDKGMFAEYGAPDTGANEDFLVLASHNETHMDALCHVFHEGLMYNGYPADSARTRPEPRAAASTRRHSSWVGACCSTSRPIRASSTSTRRM